MASGMPHDHVPWIALHSSCCTHTFLVLVVVRTEKLAMASASALRGAGRHGGMAATSRRSNGLQRGMLLVTAVAVPSKPPTARPARRSKVELIKEESDFLRHPLMAELVSEASFINEESMQLMKFHGSYQQDHREKRAFGQGKFYQFMMRTRQPAGLVTNQLYLVMDDLADQVCRACS
jgi:hypothetical protein